MTRTSIFLVCLLAFVTRTLPGQTAALVAATQPAARLDSRFTVGPILYKDDFTQSSDHWLSEFENGGKATAGQGRFDIDVPAGATIWFKPLLQGPVLIQYKATAISAGGTNDRVSDLNCFWMARDARHPDDLFAVHRSGQFADYNSLLTYYVGLGGQRQLHDAIPPIHWQSHHPPAVAPARSARRNKLAHTQRRATDPVGG